MEGGGRDIEGANWNPSAGVSHFSLTQLDIKVLISMIVIRTQILYDYDFSTNNIFVAKRTQWITL